MSNNKNNIRNFSIIAHIDHGKSTLADRILELTNTVKTRDMKKQILDSMDLEREHGITIKLNNVKMEYISKNNKKYIFNLIDTPGHVDFSYEVSRSLAACEGAILVVDATQGVEAQTLANVYLAIDNNLKIIPVINKIDLPSANPDFVKREIENLIGLDTTNCPLISAKTGLNVLQVLDAIIKYIPAPTGKDNAILKALIFDSYYDKYKGVVLSIRVFSGTIKVGDKIFLMASQTKYEVIEIGYKNPKEHKIKALFAGEVGYITASIKNISYINVGDTITHFEKQAEEPLTGYKKMNPMVFCGLYPIDSKNYDNLKDALEKIVLSDSSLIYQPESSKALGFGFRCGFLGLLHMEIIQERLEREYNLVLISTAPSVIYNVILMNNKKITIDNPSLFPEVQKIKAIEEPFVKTIIMTRERYVGSLMELCQNKRGIYKNLEYIDEKRRILTYELPLNEIVFDFFDRLKSISKGYASFEYELIGYKISKLVKMDILINGIIVDALSLIVHKSFAYKRGKLLCEKLKKIIPKQNFEVPIQAAINKKIISRETIKSLRKNVTAKCYGGDITRKRKLLENQKAGKKRMKLIGSVDIPQEAFMAILKLEDK